MRARTSAIGWALAALLAGMAALWGCSSPIGEGSGESVSGVVAAADPPPEERRLPVVAVEIALRDLSRQLVTSATVEPRAQVRVAARASGTLQSVLFEEGEAVREGEVLAVLDLSEERAELERARAREEEARGSYQRAVEMMEARLLSAAEFEQTYTALQVAESERKLWETRVSFGEILSPRSGVITARFVEPGEAVSALEPLFELTDMERLVVRLGVSELDVVHLRVGQFVPVELDAFPDARIRGTIGRIFPMAERESRLVTVEVDLPANASDRGVRPGFLARVSMPVDARSNAIAVPGSAIGERGEERYVFVIENDRLQRRVVSLGAARGQWTEVVSGLEVGEIVLATNPIDMSDGQLVRIVGWRG
jgi:membrane fusion protein, multidrug efflux system